MIFIEKYKNLINKTAKAFGIPRRDLFIKTTIDLKQFDDVILSSRDFIKDRIELTAKNIWENRKNLIEKYTAEKIRELERKKCRFGTVNWRKAKEILERFHYIGSYRKNSIHLGFYYEVSKGVENLMGIITFSRYDFTIEPYNIFINFKRHEILNLSRLYTFDWAPFNTTSYFLSQGIKYIKKYFPNIRCLTTCVNPNIGHSGTSYKASNWIEVAQFLGSPYLFLNGKPVTIRKLAEKYNTLDLNILKSKSGNRIIISKSKLLPQKIFIYILNKKKRNLFYLNLLDKIYFFDGYHFVPEYGLNNYIKENAITYNQARKRVARVGSKVIAGYLEKNNGKLYSSVIVRVGSFYKNIRKEKKWREEFIDNSNEPPTITDLPTFYKTLILICHDAKRCSKINIKKIIKKDKINTIIVISYWRNNFDDLLNSINRLERHLRPEKIICFDFFHGFHLLKF